MAQSDNIVVKLEKAGRNVARIPFGYLEPKVGHQLIRHCSYGVFCLFSTQASVVGGVRGQNERSGPRSHEPANLRRCEKRWNSRWGVIGWIRESRQVKEHNRENGQ